MYKLLVICAVLLALGQTTKSQQSSISLNLVKKEVHILPGEITNLPFFTKNNSDSPLNVQTEIIVPERWNIISKAKRVTVDPGKQVFSVFTLQAASGYPVGAYKIQVQIADANTLEILASENLNVFVEEVENITMQLIAAPEYVMAGDSLIVNYLLQNLGNTQKKVFIETSNCSVLGNPEKKLNPGESTKFSVYKLTSGETAEARKEFISARATVDENVMESLYRTISVFPSKNTKKDLFHRLPVSLSATYVSTNQQGQFRSAYQFELYGNGSLDPQQKHRLEFLARGPNNSNLSFLGMYDQYYVSYANNNMELFVGEKAFSFTPLTESSRFGIGVENKYILNNGLFLGFLYVKPRYYEEVENEYAFYSGFEKDRNNLFSIYYIRKKNAFSNQSTYLGSLNTVFQPFEKTTVELELSRGIHQEIADNAYRTNINTQFSIFNLAGTYFYTGKNYPGYYSNSTFYSGNFSANITSKLSIGLYAREDFMNAELDTFFVYAPYSKSFQTIMNYNFASRSYLKIFWREFERKDRLALDKFHYKTNSVNAQLNQKVKKFEYDILGEIGNTTNYLMEQGENKQQTYRASLNLGYRLNNRNFFRVFGSWSNINSFVSGEQRNLTAGLSANSRISKNLSAGFHVQNAYNIDDYYRNRNLMQLNVDYKFLKKHKFTLRSFYTIFRRQTDNPEFTFSATYTYNFGIPVKQLMKAGDLKGRITNDEAEPIEGVIVNLLNKSTVTDKNGEFWFKSIQPGKHLLTVDRSGFKINETINIPTPVEIDIFEDEVTSLNFKITEGAKVTGQIISDGKPADDFSPGNIILEMASEFENFRISTATDGKFSFPVVRPGKWELKFYVNSIPKGFELQQTQYNFDLKPGENVDLNIELRKKKRNIIFKSQNVSLSTSKTGSTQPIRLKASPTQVDQKQKPQNFHTIQIGAFSKKISPDSKFFNGYEFDYEKKIGDYYIYFIGTFESRKQAEDAKSELEKIFEGAFIVYFKDGKAVYNSK